MRIQVHGWWEFAKECSTRQEAEDWAHAQDCGYKICDSNGESVEVSTARIKPIETFEIQIHEKVRRRWEFPNTRFVTYEPKDAELCRASGIGREVFDTITTTIPRAFVRGGRVFAVPSPSVFGDVGEPVLVDFWRVPHLA